MLSKLKSLVQSEGVKQASLVTVGNVSATIVAAIAMIIVSRVLGPSKFGEFSALFSLLLILSKVGDLGINIATQRYIAGHIDDPMGAKRISQTGSTIKLYLSLGLGLIGLIIGNMVATSYLHLPDISSLVRLVFLFAGFVVLYEYVTSLLQAKELFGQSVITNWIQSSGKLALAAILGHLGSLSTLSAISLYLLLPLVAAWYGIIRLPKSYVKPVFSMPSARLIWQVAKWTSISIVAASIADNIDVLLVQNMLAVHETGLWSSAVRIASLASLIGWSLGSVLNVRVAKYKDKLHLDKYIRKAVLLAIISALAVLLLIPLSKFLIVITVGEDYVAAAPYLRLLFVSTAILTATSPFTALFYVFDAPEYFAYSGIISSLLLVVSDFALIPSLGTVGAGYARIVMRIVVLVFTMFYVRRSYLRHVS